MPALGHFGEYDEYLRLMAEAQRYKLRINQHKGFLGDVSPEKLLELLEGEIVELRDAQERGSKIEMLLEAADIANFALGFVIAALQRTEKEKQAIPMQYLPPGEVPAFVQRSLAGDESLRMVPRFAPDELNTLMVKDQ